MFPGNCFSLGNPVIQVINKNYNTPLYDFCKSMNYSNQGDVFTLTRSTCKSLVMTADP